MGKRSHDGEHDLAFGIHGIDVLLLEENGYALFFKLPDVFQPRFLLGYVGFPMMFSFDSFGKQYEITLRGALSHKVSLGTDVYGNITRLNNALAEMPKKLEYCREQLKTLNQQMETAKEQVNIPFEKEQELQTKSARLSELNILLNMDKRENETVDSEPDEDKDFPEKKAVGFER